MCFSLLGHGLGRKAAQPFPMPVSGYEPKKQSKEEKQNHPIHGCTFGFDVGPLNWQ